METVFEVHPLAKRLLDEFNVEADKRTKKWMIQENDLGYAEYDSFNYYRCSST